MVCIYKSSCNNYIAKSKEPLRKNFININNKVFEYVKITVCFCFVWHVLLSKISEQVILHFNSVFIYWYCIAFIGRLDYCKDCSIWSSKISIWFNKRNVQNTAVFRSHPVNCSILRCITALIIRSYSAHDVDCLAIA